MNYDTIIIGGGLSAYVAGLRLVKAGQRVAMIAAGGSTLPCNPGALALHDSGVPLNEAALSVLAADHPYRKLGLTCLTAAMAQVKPLFAEAGIALLGSDVANHYRLTPLGVFKPVWLSVDGSPTLRQPAKVGEWGNILVAGIAGMLDFFPQFLADGLRQAGASVVAVEELPTPAVTALRVDSTEKMRATNVARTLDLVALDGLAAAINRAASRVNANTVVIPAAVELSDYYRLRKVVAPRLMMMPTLPISVYGIEMQTRLRKLFTSLGGTMLDGDCVVSYATTHDGRVAQLHTARLGTTALMASNYILATGLFYSRGLVATPTGVCEPVFGCDVAQSDDGGVVARCAKDFFADQPYMSYGVATDSGFRPSIGGVVVPNLYAVGDVAGRCNSLAEGSTEGVELLTAIAVADMITNSEKGVAR